MNIHQVMSGFADGDAVSREAMLLRDVFRSWGCASDVFAQPDTVSPALRRDCRSLADYHGGSDDICLHHYGIASDAADAFMASVARKILVYHNITPSEYFAGFDDGIARRLRAARESLATIAAASDCVWADSRFNAEELSRLGVANVKVLPLLFTPASLDVEPDPLVAARITRELKNILFVGRIAPNKRIEDLISAFAWYNKSINPYSRLVIVGSDRSAPRYHAMLRMMTGDLDLPNVCFEGFASDAGLAACYRAANVYVCASVHEGYCLPLLEAMHMGVPVIARNTGGTPEAMGGAGVLYEGLDECELAELINLVVSDGKLRDDILQSQVRRMLELRQRDVDAELKQLMAGIFAG